MTLDQCLSGDSIVNSIITKVSGRLKFLYRHSQYFNQKLRENLWSALLQCHIDYCCTSWYSGINKTHQRKLQIIQNKMARFILNLSPREHISQVHLDSIKALTIHYRLKQLRLNHKFSTPEGAFHFESSPLHTSRDALWRSMVGSNIHSTWYLQD